MPYPPFPGDDRRSAWSRGPEIIAAEQRILTYADGLVSWMRQVPLSDRDHVRMDGFFTHVHATNPGLKMFDHIDPETLGQTKMWYLEKMDPDANRLFLELLRATWELRCWRAKYGEITPREHYL